MLRYCAHSEENFHAAFGDKKKMNQKKRFLGELILFQSTEREYFFYEKKKYFEISLTVMQPIPRRRCRLFILFVHDEK